MKKIETISNHHSVEALVSKLYTKYYHEVLQYVLRYTVDRSLAQDISQEVFLKLWTKREYFHQIDDITAYLFRCARNECIDYKRRENKKCIMHKRFRDTQPTLSNVTQEMVYC